MAKPRWKMTREERRAADQEYKLRQKAGRKAKRQMSRRYNDNVPKKERRKALAGTAWSAAVGYAHYGVAGGVVRAIQSSRARKFDLNARYDRKGYKNLIESNVRNLRRGGRAASNAAQV